MGKRSESIICVGQNNLASEELQVGVDQVDWMMLPSVIPVSGVPSLSLSSTSNSDSKLRANRSKCSKLSYPQPVEKGDYLYDSTATIFPKATLIGLAEATHRDLDVARETECNHSWPRSRVLSLQWGWGGGISWWKGWQSWIGSQETTMPRLWHHTPVKAHSSQKNTARARIPSLSFAWNANLGASFSPLATCSLFPWIHLCRNKDRTF